MTRARFKIWLVVFVFIALAPFLITEKSKRSINSSASNDRFRSFIAAVGFSDFFAKDEAVPLLPLVNQNPDTPCEIGSGGADLDQGRGTCKGNFRYSLLLPGTRLHLFYNSLDTSHVGFGVGWRMELDEQITAETQNDDFRLTFGEGDEIIFSKDNLTKTWSADPRLTRSVLIQNSAEEIVRKFLSGNSYTYRLYFSDDNSRIYRLTKMTGPGGDQVTLTRDPTTGLIREVEDSFGNHFSLSIVGELTEEIRCTPQNRIHLAYDSFGNLNSLVDPMENETRLSYFPGTSLLGSITSEQGSTSRITYYTNHLLAATIDARNLSRFYKYDTHSVQISGIEGHEVERFDQQGRLAAIDTPYNKTNLGWDEDGRLLKKEDYFGSASYQYEGESLFPSLIETSDGVHQAIQYDNQFNPLKVVTRGPQSTETTAYHWDERNRTVSQLTNGVGLFYVYDDKNHIITVSNEAGQRVGVYQFNSIGLLLSEEDIFGQAGSYSYDSNGNISAASDRFGQLTKIERDSQGFPTQILRPQGIKEYFAYDILGRLKWRKAELASGARLITEISQGTHYFKTQTYLESNSSFGKSIINGITQTVNPLGELVRLEAAAHGNISAAMAPFGFPEEPVADGGGWLFFQKSTPRRLELISKPVP